MPAGPHHLAPRWSGAARRQAAAAACRGGPWCPRPGRQGAAGAWRCTGAGSTGAARRGQPGPPSARPLAGSHPAAGAVGRRGRCLRAGAGGELGAGRGSRGARCTPRSMQIEGPQPPPCRRASASPGHRRGVCVPRHLTLARTRLPRRGFAFALAHGDLVRRLRRWSTRTGYQEVADTAPGARRAGSELRPASCAPAASPWQRRLRLGSSRRQASGAALRPHRSDVGV
jgi:hypothetical protein